MRLPRIEWRWAALKNGFQDATAYRWEFALEVLGAAAVPAAIQLVLWHAMYQLGGASSIQGQTYDDMIAYTLVSLLFTQVRGGDHDFELQEMIRSGGLSNYLLRPVSVVEFVYLRGVAPKLFIAGAGLILGIAVGAFLGLNPLRLVGAMLLALVGNIIHFQIGAALSTTAFLWEEAYAVLMVKNLLVSLLSGELLPLTLFPSQWDWVWRSTPFYLYVFGPTQFALGKWSTTEYFTHLGIGFVWIFVGWALIRATWGVGIRRYSSLGG
jgi:ABC-2 type transport system permease protein